MNRSTVTNITVLLFLLALILILFVIVLHFEERFNNINERYKNMVEDNFKLQLNHMNYNCIQNYDININQGISLLDAVNKKTECLIQINVAEKMYYYQNHGIEPSFTQEEVKYLEQIGYQNQFPIIDELNDIASNSTE